MLLASRETASTTSRIFSRGIVPSRPDLTSTRPRVSRFMGFLFRGVPRQTAPPAPMSAIARALRSLQIHDRIEDRDVGKAGASYLASPVPATALAHPMHASSGPIPIDATPATISICVSSSEAG